MKKLRKSVLAFYWWKRSQKKLKKPLPSAGSVKYFIIDYMSPKSQFARMMLVPRATNENTSEFRGHTVAKYLQLPIYTATLQSPRRSIKEGTRCTQTLWIGGSPFTVHHTCVTIIQSRQIGSSNAVWHKLLVQ